MMDVWKIEDTNTHTIQVIFSVSIFRKKKLWKLSREIRIQRNYHGNYHFGSKIDILDAVTSSFVSQDSIAEKKEN